MGRRHAGGGCPRHVGQRCTCGCPSGRPGSGHESRIDTCGDRARPRRLRPVIACSGGIDSLLLATIAHRRCHRQPSSRTPSPLRYRGRAPASRDTRRAPRLNARARSFDWFEDERLANPTDRCYFCKTNLYAAILAAPRRHRTTDAVIVSGANTDDLGEYRPALMPLPRPGCDTRSSKPVSKASIRAVARHLGIVEAFRPRHAWRVGSTPVPVSPRPASVRSRPANRCCVQGCDPLSSSRRRRSGRAAHRRPPSITLRCSTRFVRR